MLTCACRVPQVGTVLQYFVERTPGSVIDTKYSGFSFHFRDADPAFGLEQAKALQTQLTKMLFHANIEVLLCPDKKYLVVHAEDINKVRRAVWAPWAVCLSRVLGPYLTRWAMGMASSSHGHRELSSSGCSRTLVQFRAVTTLTTPPVTTSKRPTIPCYRCVLLVCGPPPSLCVLTDTART